MGKSLSCHIVVVIVVVVVVVRVAVVYLNHGIFESIKLNPNLFVNS